MWRLETVTVHEAKDETTEYSRRRLLSMSGVLVRRAHCASDTFSPSAYDRHRVMGAITNDPFRLARYAGMYKAVQQVSVVLLTS
jgi:hypothetical protein